MRIYTPENITKRSDLPDNAILVGGTNFEGRHGLGIAKLGINEFGAIYGQAKGLQGEFYGIITKDLKIGKRSVKLSFIYEQIVDLMIFITEKSDKVFYMSKIGCSLAGFKIEEIKSLFKNIFDYLGFLPDNIILPIEFEVRD